MPLEDNWTVCSGDWEAVEIDGNCVLRANEDGIIVWEVSPIASGERVGIMRITILNATVGAHYRIYAFYGPECAEGTWIAADLVIGASMIGTLNLYDEGGQVNIDEHTAVGPVSGVSFTMTLCVGLYYVTAEVSDLSDFVRICHDHDYNDQLYFALGNESATEVAIFDDASQIDHFDHNEQCPKCRVACCCACLEIERPTLTLTIDWEDCTVPEQTGTMTCTGLPDECCVWNLDDSFEFSCPGDDVHTFELDFSMVCNEVPGDCSQYRMTVTWPPGADNDSYCLPSDENHSTDSEASSCDCEPVNLRFGPFRLWRNPTILPYDGLECRCCEEFYVVVTE